MGHELFNVFRTNWPEKTKRLSARQSLIIIDVFPNFINFLHKREIKKINYESIVLLRLTIFADNYR